MGKVYSFKDNTEKILLQTNPFYEQKYSNSRYLPTPKKHFDLKKQREQNANKTKSSYSSKHKGRTTGTSYSKSSQSEYLKALQEKEKAERERERAEKERQMLLKKQRKGAENLMRDYDKLYDKTSEDMQNRYIEGIKAQRALNEQLAENGLYGSGYTEEKNRELALDLQNDIADIDDKRVKAEDLIERKRTVDEIHLDMMEHRYRHKSRAPKKYVDKIVEQLLKEELKKQAEAQKWANSSEWM